MRINEARPRTRTSWTAAATSVVAAVVVVGAVAAPSPARAADNVPPALSTLGEHTDHGVGRWQGSLGIRTSFLRDPGYDPFSSNDVLTQLSLSVMRAFGSAPGLIPAVGLVWDTGAASGEARGVQASLGLMRLAIAVEARFLPARGVYVMGRLAPGVLRASATLVDASAPAPLETSYTSPSLDGSVGAGVRLTPAAAPVAFWVVGDGGYGWGPTHDLVLTPALPKTDAQKAGATSLGSLAARGAFFRLGLALSY